MTSQTTIDKSLKRISEPGIGESHLGKISKSLAWVGELYSGVQLNKTSDSIALKPDVVVKLKIRIL